MRAEKRRQQKSPESPPTAIMVATFERHKDHETALRAVPLIRQQVPGFRLLLAGDGTLRDQLHELARELALCDAVEFLGMRRDVPELLGIADLFVLSTTPQEGLGTVMIEALAAGLRVVASDVPACRELLNGGEYGVLVTPRSPEALARAVINCLESADEQRDHRIAYATNFTPQKMIKEYLTIAGVAALP